MDKFLRKSIDESEEKFNDVICDGLSRQYVPTFPEYLSSVFKSAMTTLPESIPFTYNGYRRLTPLEDFYNNINAAATRNNIDITKNYLYKVEYSFTYNGMDIKRIIALPYVERGGHLVLSDANYVLTPVLSEYPVSPAPGEIFIRLLRDKLNIKKKHIKILVNGIPSKVGYIYSKSYKLIDKVNDTIPIVIYGVIKYGFYGLFMKEFNTRPIVKLGDDLKSKDLTNNYTEFTTTGIKPRTLKVANYTPHKIHVYIKNEDVSPLLESYIAGLLMCWDYSPLYSENIIKVLSDKHTPNTVFDFNTIDKESLYWITLLGKVIFKNKYTMDRVVKDMLEHINILNGYLDSIVKERLKEINVNVEDFFDLFIWSINNFTELVMQHETYSSKLSNRYLDLPYYILFDLIVGINKAFLEFKRIAVNKVLTEREINRLFNRFISTRKIYGITKGSGMNIAISPVDYTGDNYIYKMSGLLEDQNRGAGTLKSKKNVFPISIRQIHGEDIFFGSMTNLSKKSPSPRLKFNPFVNVDVTSGKFMFSKEDIETINILELKVAHTLQNDGTMIDESIEEMDKID